MSGLSEPPGGEPLCIYLLRDGGAGEGRREVACQWESPEEETKEVGCQWESPEDQKRDAAVQVDLLMQQLSWTRTGDQLRAAGTFCRLHSIKTTADMTVKCSDPLPVGRLVRRVAAVRRATRWDRRNGSAAVLLSDQDQDQNHSASHQTVSHAGGVQVSEESPAPAARSTSCSPPAAPRRGVS